MTQAAALTHDEMGVIIDQAIEKMDELRAERDQARQQGDAKLEAARDAFLNLFAEADRFDEDVDGEYHTDSAAPSITVRYFCEFGESELRELVKALGLPVRYCSTAGDAINERLTADAADLASRVDA